MFRRMSTNIEEISKSFRSVVDRVQKATDARPQTLPKITPRLVAVSKTKPIADIQAAYSLGQRHFGENYVQELKEKSSHPEILAHCKDIRWHFIGHLQGNKTKVVANTPNLYMVETIDSQKLAQTLNNQWERQERPGQLKIMVQVNTSGEQNKSGCNPCDVAQLCRFVREKCPRLELGGLMTIGTFGYNPDDGPNPDFVALVKCREDLCRDLNLKLEEVELSMGMSSDYEHAIGLGSTNVRVGSTIFGARSSNLPRGRISTAASPPTSEGSQSGAAGDATPTAGDLSQAAGSQVESPETIVNGVNSIDLTSKDKKDS